MEAERVCWRMDQQSLLDKPLVSLHTVRCGSAVAQIEFYSEINIASVLCRGLEKYWFLVA